MDFLRQELTGILEDHRVEYNSALLDALEKYIYQTVGHALIQSFSGMLPEEHEA